MVFILHLESRAGIRESSPLCYLLWPRKWFFQLCGVFSWKPKSGILGTHVREVKMVCKTRQRKDTCLCLTKETAEARVKERTGSN